MKTLVVGDMHLMQLLPYHEYVEDKRLPEKQKVLDFIIAQSEGVERVVLLGDNINVKNPTAEVIREFTEFLERFKVDVYIIAGNHESNSLGKTCIDYLKEIKGKKWHVITNEVKTLGDATFLPYFTNSQLDVVKNSNATEKILGMLPNSKYLFLHHTISGTLERGVSVDDFPEPILPREELKKRFQMIVGGHIHTHSLNENVLVAGSVFTHSVGELEKFIWKIDDETLEVEKIKLPCRPIIKLENPTAKEIEALKKNSIVKIIFTKSITLAKLEKLKEELTTKLKDGGFILIDQTSKAKERKDLKNTVIDLSIDNLLDVYAKEREIDVVKLKQGFNLIK